MTSHRIDVLVPTYNPNPHHLREALETLQKQSYSDWKVYIHDESDCVDCRAIVEPFLSDARFTFQKSSKRLGIGGNWNACRTATHAPYIAYLFHDDRWDPEYLAKGVAMLDAHPTAGLVALHHHYGIEGDISTAEEYRLLEAWRTNHLRSGLHPGLPFLRAWLQCGLRPNVIGEPSFTILRRSVCDQVGYFNEDMPQSLDTEYWVRMLQNADWCFESASLGIFRVHAEGTTAQNRKQGRGLFDRFRILIQLERYFANGPDHRLASRALQQQLAEMVGRYLQRRKSGGTVGYSGSGKVKQYALRHPWRLLRAVLTALCTKLPAIPPMPPSSLGL